MAQVNKRKTQIMRESANYLSALKKIPTQYHLHSIPIQPRMHNLNLVRQLKIRNILLKMEERLYFSKNVNIIKYKERL